MEQILTLKHVEVTHCVNGCFCLFLHSDCHPAGPFCSIYMKHDINILIKNVTKFKMHMTASYLSLA